MNEELIKEIFITIAFRAMDSGKELRLEKGKNTSKSNVLGGAFSLSASEYDSLSLLVHDGEYGENVDEDDEDQAEDGE
jgi:hypothetical protein